LGVIEKSKDPIISLGHSLDQRTITSPRAFRFQISVRLCSCKDKTKISEYLGKNSEKTRFKEGSIKRKTPEISSEVY
jgi:hypothetical protein